MSPHWTTRRVRRWHVLGTVAALVLLASGAHADDRAAARPLFDEGRQLMKAGKIAEACAKFEAASHLTSTSGVRLNLANCWARLGRAASAWGMYDEARAIAERNGDSAAAERAQKEKAALEPRLSRLVIAVAPANAAGLQVTRDGEPVFSGAWGVGIPVDPGSHEIDARAPGRKAWSTKASVPATAAASFTVTVPVLEVEAVAPAVATTSPAKPEGASSPESSHEAAPALPSSRGMSTRAIAGLSIAGVGVVVAAVGAVFGAEALSKNSASDASGDCTENLCNATGFATRNTARSDGDVSSVLIGVGAAAIVGGGVLWLTAPTSGTTQGSAGHVTVGIGPTGLAVKGVF